jgi:hypothetical protein
MKNLKYLSLVISSLLTLVFHALPAEAIKHNSGTLNFDLPPVNSSEMATSELGFTQPSQEVLSIPPEASQPPLGEFEEEQAIAYTPPPPDAPLLLATVPENNNSQDDSTFADLDRINTPESEPVRADEAAVGLFPNIPENPFTLDPQLSSEDLVEPSADLAEQESPVSTGENSELSDFPQEDSLPNADWEQPDPSSPQHVGTNPDLPSPIQVQEDDVPLSFSSGAGLEQSIASADDAPADASPRASEIARHLQPLAQSLESIFWNGSNSLVAVAIGAAEGTRTPWGDRTPAYNGHTDPGNGAWNLGSFSYQHGASSPEEADRLQLARLQRQAVDLERQAVALGMTLTLEEKLNGLDLANQSPEAALAPGGYIDRLREAHDAGLRGSDAILHARTTAYRDPLTQRWNAPGLGNTRSSIEADQQRRMQAIALTMESYRQPPQISSSWSVSDEDFAALAERNANQIIALDLSL